MPERLLNLLQGAAPLDQPGRERMPQIVADDGFEAWRQVVERGYEGYVVKDEASAYEGGATRRWLKVKQRDWTVAEDGWRRQISVAVSLT